MNRASAIEKEWDAFRDMVAEHDLDDLIYACDEITQKLKQLSRQTNGLMKSIASNLVHSQLSQIQLAIHLSRHAPIKHLNEYYQRPEEFYALVNELNPNSEL